MFKENTKPQRTQFFKKKTYTFYNSNQLTCEFINTFSEMQIGLFFFPQIPVCFSPEVTKLHFKGNSEI